MILRGLKRLGHAFGAGWERGRRAVASDDHTADTAENAPYWRTNQRPNRDMDPAARKAMQDDAARAHQRYGKARRAVANLRGFVVGAIPVRPKSDDSRVQAKLDALWDHPRNSLEARIPEWSNDLSVHGELCVLLAAGATSSLTVVGFLDPGAIHEVASDPDDAQRRIGVIVKLPLDNYRVHPIVGPDSTLDDMFANLLEDASVTIEMGTAAAPRKITAKVGQPCVYARANALAGQTRGDSDLYPALDALAARDRGVFGFMERLGLFGAFVWDLALPNTKKGADVKKQTEEAAKAIGRGVGGVYGHTENTTLSAISPDLKSADWSEGIKIPDNDVLDTFGQPSHWFAGGGAELSLASAGEKGSPAWTMLQERQTVLRRFIRDLGNYALSRFPEGEVGAGPWKWDLTLPTIVGKDAVREAAVLNSQLTAIGQLQDMGLKHDAAVREAVKLGNSYGLDLAESDFDESMAIRSRIPMPGDPVNPDTPPDPMASGKVTSTAQTGDEPQARGDGMAGRQPPTN